MNIKEIIQQHTHKSPEENDMYIFKNNQLYKIVYPTMKELLQKNDIFYYDIVTNSHLNEDGTSIPELTFIFKSIKTDRVMAIEKDA